jgi:heme exporter protein A
VLAGLLSPSRGTVTVLGVKLPGNAELRGRIGFVAHDALLYSELTARENLAHYCRLYRVDQTERIDEMLAAVELAGAADRLVRTYSRGMLQRLALARALLHRPELLLLDEPFTGLDPAGAGLLVDLLRVLKASEVTVAFTTHDVERGLELADRAVLLHAGRIAWESGEALPDSARMRSIYASVTASTGT